MAIAPDLTTMRAFVMLVLFSCLGLSDSAFAATYWVSPTGAATWANCASASPLASTAACSMARANVNAVAGDTIYLRAGTYSTLTGLGVINPTNSGTSGRMIHFSAAPGESPNVAPASHWAILLIAKDYIKISGINFTGAATFFYLGNGADHNEITNCIFAETTSAAYYSVGLITQTNTAGLGCTGSTNNWIHHNTFTKYGNVTSCADNGTIRIAADPTIECGEDESYHNTVDDNVFSYGGHDLVDLGGRYNSVRNNVFHNEESHFAAGGGCINSPTSGYFGNRNLIVSGYTNTDSNLIEGNRLGFGGTPPDDDGANGIENSGNDMIVRYNTIFGNGASGVYLKNQVLERPDNNRIYNNTIFSNGFGDVDIDSQFKYGIYMNLWDFVNVSHNSVTYRCIKAHITADDKEPGVSAGWETYWAVGALAGARTLGWATYKGTTYDVELRPKGNVIKNNIVYGNAAEHSIVTTGGLNTYANNTASNPTFVNPLLTDPTSLVLPDLRLQSASPAINGGTYLTQANGAGSGSTTLIVDDAMYFQDGTWGSDLARGITFFPDWISIGTVGSVVRISSVNYASNTITLASPMTWSNGAKIWLYKKSDGAVVLVGAAPDYGASEFGAGTTLPVPPTSLQTTVR